MQRFVLFAVLSGIVLAGCATLPTMKNSDDCLVVVKTEVINKTILPISTENSFVFSSDYPAVRLSRSEGFVAFVVREPAVKIVSISSSPANGFSGSNYSHPVDVLLPYSSGRIVVADFVFRTQLRGNGSMTYFSNDFRPITDAERDELLQKVLKNSKGGWQP